VWPHDLSLPCRILSALAAAAMLSPAAAQKVWKTYKNEPLGTTVEYPPDKFIPQPPLENGDGLRFIATDGAEFTVSAINTVLDQNLAAIAASTLEDQAPDEKITSDRGPNLVRAVGGQGRRDLLRGAPVVALRQDHQ
jgi:hypothetical protein